MVPNLLPATMYGTIQDLPAPGKLDDYAAWVLKQYYLAIHHFCQTDQNTVLCDYNQGMPRIIKQFLEMSLQTFTAQESNQIDARLQKHSKNPDTIFSGDKDLEIDVEHLDSLREAYALTSTR